MMMLPSFIGINRAKPSASSPPAGNVLDLMSVSPAFAYSPRKLRSAYSGFAMRVRRSSDNTEANIGFTAGGDLDTTALLAHCGAGNGFVTTWYDQSANGRNAFNTTASTQPQIVASGSVVTLPSSSRPTVQFTKGSATRLDSTAFTSIPQPYSLTTVYNYYTTTTGNHPLFWGGTGAYTGVYSTTQFIMYSGSVANSNGGRTANTNYVNTSAYNTTTSNSFSNGTQVATNISVGGAGVNKVQIGNDVSLNGDFASAYISELIFFGSTLSTTNRQTLERNQGTYYSITVA